MSAPVPREDAFVDGYLAYLLARASHLISGEFHAMLAERGVPVIHWRVMAALWESRSLTLGELAEVVLMKQPTVSKIVTRMQAAGLVARTGDATDRRNVRIALTRAGARAARPLIAAAAAHETRVLQPFGRARERVLIGVLQQLIQLHARGVPRARTAQSQSASAEGPVGAASPGGSTPARNASSRARRSSGISTGR